MGGDIVSAARAYASALSLKASNSNSHLKLGRLHKERAARCFRSALKLNPENSEAATELRTLGVSEQELASIIEIGNKSRGDIRLSPACRGVAATLSPSIPELGRPAAKLENNSKSEPIEQLSSVSNIDSNSDNASPENREQRPHLTAQQQSESDGTDYSRIFRRARIPSLVGVLVVLCLVAGGALKFAGLATPSIDTVQHTYRRAISEFRRLTGQEAMLRDWRQAEIEGEQRATVQEEVGSTAEKGSASAVQQGPKVNSPSETDKSKARDEESERKAAEDRAVAEQATQTAAEAVARRHDEEALKALEEKILADAAREVAEAAARNRAQKAAKSELPGDSSVEPKQTPSKGAEENSGSDAEIRAQAERTETDLNLTVKDRRQVQMALAALGYDFPTVTGYFGPRSRAMIAAWQKKNGLPGTGFLNGAQFASLYERLEPGKRQVDPPKPDVRQHAEGKEATLHLSEEDRKRVQVALNSLGHEIPTVTGFFGTRTRAMISEWQKTRGLTETGYLTDGQLAMLQEQAAPALAKYDQALRKP